MVRAVEFGGVQWCVHSRYALKQRVGFGSSGIVVAGTDARRGGAAVAIKKVTDVFDIRRILREVRLMRLLEHPTLIKLLDASLTDSLYLVTHLMSMDLERLLSICRTDAGGFRLRAEQNQFLAYQLVCGLTYLHAAGVMHRDVKPSNLLVDLKSCSLRICDFGLARCFATGPGGSLEEDEQMMTEYVVTRWYRAPEVLLGDCRYGPKIDCWAAGCIVAELLAPKRGVLFKGGERREMIARILEVLGPPAEENLWFVTDDHARAPLCSRPPGTQTPPRPAWRSASCRTTCRRTVWACCAAWSSSTRRSGPPPPPPSPTPSSSGPRPGSATRGAAPSRPGPALPSTWPTSKARPETRTPSPPCSSERSTTSNAEASDRAD